MSAADSPGIIGGGKAGSCIFASIGPLFFLVELAT